MAGKQRILPCKREGDRALDRVEIDLDAVVFEVVAVVEAVAEHDRQLGNFRCPHLESPVTASTS